MTEAAEIKIAELEAEMQDDDIDVPDRLSESVEALQEKDPKMPWDQAVWELVQVEDG